MNAEQFTYWLQGFVELHGSLPTEEQWKSIKDHLGLVHNKITPVVNPYPIRDSWQEHLWPTLKPAGPGTITC